MFVWNLKINVKLFLKIVFAVIAIILLAVLIFSGRKIFGNRSQIVKDDLNLPDISSIDSKNFTNVLKAVYDNLDQYEGQKVSFTGYIYRVSDIKNNEFIVARSMPIGDENQVLVVGFLCEHKKGNDFANETWVNVTGTIKKGNYHGEIPIIDIKEITETEQPEDDLVPPPDDSYIPTSVVL